MRIFGTMGTLRLLLLPFAWVYALVLRARHALYDSGILKSDTPALPTIVVGNISLGGTGKTPHVELLLRTLLANRNSDPPLKLATLSRGYGRRMKEFAEVATDDPARDVGDEPLMLKQQFTGVRVFVGDERVRAIGEIARIAPDTQAVILDDALQHRKLEGSLNLVLTTWRHPWYRDHLLPAGQLRDIPYRARQADVVVVTKCPKLPTPEEQVQFRERLKLKPAQQLFFSGLEYDAPRYVLQKGEVPTGKEMEAVLFTGIADPAPLYDHAERIFGKVNHIPFRDHHYYTLADQERLVKVFHSFASSKKLLVTTTKDVARLGKNLNEGPLKDLPVVVIGVRAVILNEPFAFEALIRTHVRTHTTHR